MKHLDCFRVLQSWFFADVPIYILAAELRCTRAISYMCMTGWPHKCCLALLHPRPQTRSSIWSRSIQTQAANLGHDVIDIGYKPADDLGSAHWSSYDIQHCHPFAHMVSRTRGQIVGPEKKGRDRFCASKISVGSWACIPALGPYLIFPLESVHILLYIFQNYHLYSQEYSRNILS